MARIPLALLPGTLCNEILWASQVEVLSDIADPCVIDVTQHSDLAGIARYILGVMPQPFALAGLSFGGIVAFEVWRQNRSAVSHMALLNTNPMPASPARREQQRHLVEIALNGKFREVTTDHLKDTMLHPDHQKDMVLRAQVLTMAEAVGVQGFINQIEAQINRPDSRPTLSAIDCPTLVLTGDRDNLCTPEMHRDMAMQIPNATLRIVPNCGHLSTLEQPEIISSAMRTWLMQ